MDANEEYLDSLLNSVLSQDMGGGEGGLDNAQQNSGSEAELEEINDLLKKSDQNQMPDAEMLAILERAESEMSEETSDQDVPDVFDIFSSESVELEESYAKDHAAGETPTSADGMQGEADGEAYLNGLLNGAKTDDMPGGSGQSGSGGISTDENLLSLDDLQGEEETIPAEEENLLSLDDLRMEDENLLSLDDLQGEEETMPAEEPAEQENLLSLDDLQGEEETMSAEEPAGEENLLSLDDLPGEEEAMPTAEAAGEENLLSLDDLQGEEEAMPMEEPSGEEDLFSLDSLQSEEESAPMEAPSGEEDLFSLDSLQSEEEPSLMDGPRDEDDLLSLDSLQSDEEMSFGGLSGEEDLGYGSSTEEDDAIQKEIDELLGLAGTPGEENSAQNDAVSVSDASDMGNGGEDTSSKADKKEKKKKKKLFGRKKTKEAAETVADGAQESASAGMEAKDQTDSISGDAAADEMMTEDDLSSAAQETEAPGGKKQKSKRKKEKAGKQKKAADSEKESKEPGFFAKLFNSLLEEADEEEEQPQELEVSDENREIMAMMENEKIENKKPGKKAKKGKKGKAEAKQAEDGEGDEEAPVDEKKAKKEKKKKEKKEKKEQKEKAKKEKEQEEKAVPTKKLPRAKVFSIFAFCLTLLAVIVILCLVIPKQQDLKTAREAYYNRDYLTVYQNMDGKDLSDSDYILYMRSRMILNMQSKLDNYLVYMGMDKEMAALNELMLAVHYYQSNLSVAESYGAVEEMDTVYRQVLSVLDQQYQLSETEAIEIFALDDLSYNERLYYLVHGTEFVAPDVPQSGSTNNPVNIGTSGSGNEILDDMLPEENELSGGDQPQGTINDAPEAGSDTGLAEPSADQSVNDGNAYWPESDWSDGSGTDAGNENWQPDTDGENQPQNTSGESLSQGSGEELYSGEVQNGSVVLQ